MEAIMRYTVFNQGRAVRAFDWFFDAWLFAILELGSYSRIRERGSNEVWTINPKTTN
jgi:hypothetical protein